MNDKEQFIIRYLEKEKFVDVLNQDFMVAFAMKFDCRVFRQTIGAPRVPLAGKTLSAMFKKGLLSRFTCGIDGYAGGVGFPKWVYSYSLAKPNHELARIMHNERKPKIEWFGNLPCL